jgi:hypothetical protein
MHEGLIDAAIPVQKEIAKLAPVGKEPDRGRLSKGVRYEVKGGQALIWPAVWYSNVQERGATLVPTHRRKVYVKGKKTMVMRQLMSWKDDAGRLHFAKKVTIRGKFFIKRGAEAASPEAARALAQATRRAVAAAIGVEP